MKKIKKYLVILFIVLIILIGIFLILVNNPINRNIRYIYNEKKQGNISIMPNNNSELFMKYNGRNDQRAIYKSMYIFVNETVEKYNFKQKELNDDNLSTYFNKNKTNIEKELGIKKENEFIEFSKELKKLNNEKLQLEEYTINPNTIKAQNTYTQAVLLVKYKNNNKVGFKIKFLNSINENRIPIIVNGGVSEEDLSYEYIPNEYVSPLNNTPGKVIK